MKMQIVVRTKRRGHHCWPGAFSGRKYLQHSHPHLFQFVVYYTVAESRRVEFHDALVHLEDMLDAAFSRGASAVLDFGSLSCEEIAEFVLDALTARRVEVWEDETCGAVVERE